MNNPRPSENMLLQQFSRDLGALLPAHWSVTTGASSFEQRLDSTATIQSGAGKKSTLVLEAKSNLAPGEVTNLIARLRARAETSGKKSSNIVIIAPYLSETTQELIQNLGASYYDTTGNILMQTADPPMFIKTQGASKDPWPSSQSLQTLKGRGTARVVRSLVEFMPPYGVREIAERAHLPLGTLARTLALLERDGLVIRNEKGSVTEVDWDGVIRRWAKDYDVQSSNRVHTFLNPRGTSDLILKLKSFASGYAITGALGAQQYVPVTSSRLATLYVDNISNWADQLKLKPAESGVNVWLLEPYGDVVFARSRVMDGVISVNPGQLAVDLLTGPGRDPSEAQELFVWMERNQDVWRTRCTVR